MTDADADTAPSTADLLLGLQLIDTESDQLAHRRTATPLHEQFATATRGVREWEQRRTTMTARIDELGTAIEAAEQRGVELAADRERLEQQLKTVIAPREAEALMHEIETVGRSIDDLDVTELEALEEQSQLDDRLVEHAAAEHALRNALQQADSALSAEVADIDAQLGALAVRRDELRPSLADGLLATYDRKRAALGVAVARLEGRQCLGCHLDLSPAEIDTVRDEAEGTGVTDCPQCGRLLVI